MDNLYIIIPAYNEAVNIEQVVKDWHPVVAHISSDSKLVIIDDGSKDDTYARLCALVKDFPQLQPITKPNAGHGATIYYGYEYALAQNADYIFQTDSDGQTLASEFPLFWEQRKNYSVLIGHRNRRQDGLSRVFVTKTLKAVLWLVFHVSVTDANTPFRLMERQVLKRNLPLIPRYFNLTNVLLSVCFSYYKENVTFIPITFRPRQGAVNSINLRKIFKIGLKAVKDFRTFKKSLTSTHPTKAQEQTL